MLQNIRFPEKVNKNNTDYDNRNRYWSEEKRMKQGEKMKIFSKIKKRSGLYKRDS